jgi:hypothetical protein
MSKELENEVTEETMEVEETVVTEMTTWEHVKGIASNVKRGAEKAAAKAKPKAVKAVKTIGKVALIGVAAYGVGKATGLIGKTEDEEGLTDDVMTDGIVDGEAVITETEESDAANEVTENNETETE